MKQGDRRGKLENRGGELKARIKQFTVTFSEMGSIEGNEQSDGKRLHTILKDNL